MFDKTLSELVKFLSNTPFKDEAGTEKREVFSSSTTTKSNFYENVQIFSDHLKTARRFQKTFYYGDLLQSSFHPPLALTDATLELFNKTVPNAGRLDILDMDYATSVSETICVSPYSMVLAMMYLEQLRHKNPDYLENVSPCDLFVVSILVASKYLFDSDEELIYNCDWADAANIDIEELNRQEKDFLLAMNWQLFTEASDFFGFLCKIEERIARKQSSQRGWLSYTDLFVLSRNEMFAQFCWNLSGIIIKSVFVVTVSYAAAVSVLYGTLSITFVAQAPVKNFILEMKYSENLSPSFTSFEELSTQEPCGSDVIKQNDSFHCDYSTECQITGFCAVCEKADENLPYWTWFTRGDSLYQSKQNVSTCHNNQFLQPLGNDISKLSQVSLLFKSLYNNSKKLSSVMLPLNCHSIVIKPHCNYTQYPKYNFNISI